MNEEVMISVKPNWCELYAKGKKTIEIRKTKPNISTPFRGYIYCTKSQLLTKSHNDGNIYVVPDKLKRCQESLELCGNTTLSGKVIGEFVCEYINEYLYVKDEKSGEEIYTIPSSDLEATCLKIDDLYSYGKGKTLYGWEISNLVIYDKPKDLSEFKKFNRKCEYGDLGYAKPKDCNNCDGCRVQKPPQSWCFVEGIDECSLIKCTLIK